MKNNLLPNLLLQTEQNYFLAYCHWDDHAMIR